MEIYKNLQQNWGDLILYYLESIQLFYSHPFLMSIAFKTSLSKPSLSI